MRPRPAEEMAAALRLAFAGMDEGGVARAVAAFGRIAAALAKGERARAAIAAVQIGLPEIAPEGMAKRAASPLAKYNPYHDPRGLFTSPPFAVPVADAAVKPWQHHANIAMREKLAELERSAEHANDGYQERSSADDGALGRYQLRPSALIDAGWMNPDHSWSDKARAVGVDTDEKFLHNPEAQEMALTDVMQGNWQQLKAYGVWAMAGTTITDSHRYPLPITPGGLMVAAHKEGAGAVKLYLNPAMRAGLAPEKIPIIENRLRNGADTPYDPAATAAEVRARGAR